MLLIILPLVCVFVCNEKNCSEHLQTCEETSHCLTRGRSSVSSGFHPPASASFGKRQRGRQGSFLGEGGAPGSMWICVRVTVVSILAVTSQNPSLSDSEP